ncbi:MAG: hypothetical protein H6866_05230 [Rhodospirillales bacterium]|nr:MAG: hypothetical protein H6866_05230 [Rhodospirillales bacterium]
MPPDPHASLRPPEQGGPVDPALAEGAIARIRKQVQGNGLKPSAVELRGVAGQVYGFFATTSVKLVPSVKEGRRAGRHSDGQIIQPHQIDTAIQDFIGRVASDRGVLALVQETVLSRPDHGFGVGGETIPLPQVARNFIAHEACPACRGAGGTPCHNCHGQMRITCYRCHGQGGIPCVTCSGRGQILTPQGPVTCHNCHGRGLSQCPVCMGQRMITCPECAGQGRRVCESCQGQGWMTHNWSVTLNAQTSFRIRTRGLPPAMVALIERVGGARLAADQHAKITPLLGRDMESMREFADVERGASLWFLYQAEMPFAELDIAMGKATIRPRLAGFRARMVDVPDFMDALLKPGTDNLHDAAQGGAGAAQMILASARYRALGDVLRGLIRMPPRRVMKALMDSYPLGLSDATARAILKDASTALSRLSLWPRTMVTAGALAVSFMVDAAFYLYGGRSWLSATLAQNGYGPAMAWMADLLLILLLGLGGIHAIRVMARRSLRTVLEGLGIVAGGNLPLPRPGAPGLWLWGGVIAMALVFAFISGILALF